MFIWVPLEKAFKLPKGRAYSSLEEPLSRASDLINILFDITRVDPKVILVTPKYAAPNSGLIKDARRAFAVLLYQAYPNIELYFIGELIGESERAVVEMISNHKMCFGTISFQEYRKLYIEASKRFGNIVPLTSLNTKPVFVTGEETEEPAKPSKKLGEVSDSINLPEEAHFVFTRVLSFEKFRGLLYRAISEELGLSKLDMKNGGRIKDKVQARQIFCFIFFAAHLKDVTHEMIGREFGKTHSEVSYYVGKHRELIEGETKDMEYCQDYLSVANTFISLAQDAIARNDL